MARSTKRGLSGPDGLRSELQTAGRRRREARSALPGRQPSRNDLLPALRREDRDLASLRMAGRKVRVLDPGHVREVAASIRTLGFSVPVIIDQDGTILDGVVRVEAAKMLGLGTVPCIVADHLTAAEKRVLRLAVNRLGEKGGWDLGELRLEFEELIVEDAPIEITGFSLAEIDEIRLDDEVGTPEVGPLEPEGTPVARIGDAFRLGPHRLICGDARDPELLAHLMGELQARMVLTDQPYNVPVAGHVTGGGHREFVMASGEMSPEAFSAFNEAWIGSVLPHLREGGTLATFIDWRGLVSVTDSACSLGLTQLNLIVWAKPNAGMGSLYRSQHELFPLFKKGDAPHINNVQLGRKGRWRSNVWTYPGASSVGSDARRGLKDHPTVKPVAMLEDALLDLTDRGDVVLDPFLGSGSTLIAAGKTGRVCRGIDLDPGYVDVTIRRYERATDKEAVLETTGQTFAELTAERLQPASAQPKPPVRPRSVLILPRRK